MKLPRLSPLALALALAACGGSDNASDPVAPVKTQISGVFLDGAVEGL